MPGKMPTASNPRSVSRPAQGNNSRVLSKPARPAYLSGVVSDSAAAGTTGPNPKRVSRGSVSRPSPLPKWRPTAQAAPRRVSNPKTIA